jgi:non-ribosomal peptide synthetase component F
MFEDFEFQQQKELAKKVSSVKKWVCSGERLELSLLVLFFDLIGTRNRSRLCNFYGSTEVTADATWIVFESKEQALDLVDGACLPIGRPISNTNILILDQQIRQAILQDIPYLLVYNGIGKTTAPIFS